MALLLLLNILHSKGITSCTPPWVCEPYQRWSFSLITVEESCQSAFMHKELQGASFSSFGLLPHTDYQPLKMVENGDSCNLHFFRLLLPGFSKKLDLPTAFAEHIVKEKCNMTTATVVSPNGGSWHVDVCKGSMQARMYFAGESWQKFVRAHNLGLGYFLVFCYRGNMMFSFRAYDLSSCEIASYASIGSRNGDVKGDQKNKGIISEEKKASIEKKISEVKIENQKVFDESITVKRRKKIPENQAENKKISDEFTTVKKKTNSKERAENKKKADEVEHENLTTSSIYKRIMKSVHKERTIRNNWSTKARFEATINPCNLYQSYMNIPWRFSDKIGLTKHQQLFLMDPEGRRWSVRVHHRRVRFGNYRNSSCMSAGWEQFAAVNNLKVGERCIFHFELVANNTSKVAILKVQIGTKAI